MTNSEVLESVWSALQSEAQTRPGVYERRVFAQSPFDIFAGVVRPGNLPQLAFNWDVPPGRSLEFEARGVVCETDSVGISPRLSVRIQLTSPIFRDMFLALTTDLVEKVLGAQSPSEAFARFDGRLAAWRRFMQSTGPQGLSTQEQAGLFGELLVLRSLLTRCSADCVLSAWTGPSGANQDFFLDRDALEVKTSTTNDQAHVRISNEFQLDSLNLNTLSLCHIVLDVRAGSGTSLPILIEQIESELGEGELTEFRDLLFAAGYLDRQRTLYETRGYAERERNYYRVIPGFPRLIKSDLVLALDDVSYRLNLPACASFRWLEAEAMATFLKQTDA